MRYCLLAILFIVLWWFQVTVSDHESDLEAWELLDQSSDFGNKQNILHGIMWMAKVRTILISLAVQWKNGKKQRLPQAVAISLYYSKGR